MRRLLVLSAALLFCLQLQAQKARYLEEIKKAADKGWRDNPRVIQEWKRNAEPSVLWGYNSPAHPIYLAGTLAFLFEETGEARYAARAAELLASYGDLRQVLPKDYAKTRVEYREGVPPLSNFFFMPPYVRAYYRIRNSDALSAKTRATIERDLAETVDFIFRFPEWGGHNRAMLRAEAYIYAALAMPGHPRAAAWKQMAEVIAGDNLHRWEIEDASGYHPVWLHALFSYAEAAGRQDQFRSAFMRYYYDYYLLLIGPNGTIPDFGDAVWNSSASGLRFVAVFEKGAAVEKDSHLKWAAQTLMHTVKAGAETLGIGDAYHLCDAYRWTDESIRPEPPGSLSREVLDDVVGKKIVFRDGWDPQSMYCLLTYRDEGDGGWLDRRYLRTTISVEEEKMHHGHADENSIVLLMNKGSVLLHDGGYRDALPSGRYGAWRQDYFHNRIVTRLNKRDKSQGLLDFVRNAGSYRPVRTQKVDFRTLRDVDMSRTRLVDEDLGYRWDRVIVYVRDPGYFVVVDGIKVLRSDYFTFASLWHARSLLRRGEHFYDIATDSLPGYSFSPAQSLLVSFLETYAKQDSVEPIRRHSQDEYAISQTISSQYKAGDTELFVTLLYPHSRTIDPARIAAQFTLVPVSAPSKAVAVELPLKQGRAQLCVMLDLDMEIARENVRPRTLFDLGKVRYGDFETDAHLLFASASAGNVTYSAVNVLKVLYKGKTLMEALPNTHGLQLDGSPDDHVGYSKWRTWEDTVPLR